MKCAKPAGGPARLVLSLWLTLAAGFFAAPAMSQEIGQKESMAITHGRDLARINCSRCHSIDLDGKSPVEKAPPFWTMFTRRDVATIADMLVRQAGPKHSDMPDFTITRRQAEDIGTWIAWVQPVNHGKRLVEANCARCHATGRKGDSLHAEAPPFRTLYKRYPIDALAEAFAEGVETGHPDMPVFKMTNLQINDVLAYMESIQGE